jgi:hypothetical protein
MKVEKYQNRMPLDLETHDTFSACDKNAVFRPYSKHPNGSCKLMPKLVFNN